MSEVVDADAAAGPVVFDARAVDSLTGHADDHELARVFVSRYRRLLPERLRRIVTTLREQDTDAAMDAVLSLKVASRTVGAGELSDLGALIEARLRRLDLAGAAALAAQRLPAAAARADGALASYLDG